MRDTTCSSSRCKRPAAPNRKLCQGCIDSQHRYYEKLKRLGLCAKCGQAPREGGFTTCGPCHTKWHAYGKAHHKKWRDQLLDTVLDRYGRQCVCCGETRQAFLTFDHINGDGSKRRREGEGTGTKLHKWLIKSGFPPDFRILCWNCNSGRHINKGVCPHEEEQALAA